MSVDVHGGTNKSLSICALGSLYAGEDPNYLELALDSLRAQSLQLPVIMVIDGPLTPDLEEVLTRNADLEISFVRLGDNVGLGPALNAGLRVAERKYEYAIRFDTDDINRADRFEIIHNVLANNPVDLVSSHMREIDEAGTVKSHRYVPLNHEKIASQLVYRSSINHPASAFKISACMGAGGYKNMPFLEDWYLWLRMKNSGCKMMNISEHLVDYRLTKDAIKRRYGLGYARCEVRFFWARWTEGLVSFVPNFLALTARLLSKVFGVLAFSIFFKAARRVFKY